MSNIIKLYIKFKQGVFMKTLIFFLFGFLFINFISCLKVSVTCDLAVPQSCSLKYNINKLEKHQIDDALKNWAGLLDTSITDSKFIAEFKSHPLIKLFINKQLQLSSMKKEPNKNLSIFTVNNLKNLKINNQSL